VSSQVVAAFSDGLRVQRGRRIEGLSDPVLGLSALPLAFGGFCRRDDGPPRHLSSSGGHGKLLLQMHCFVITWCWTSYAIEKRLLRQVEEFRFNDESSTFCRSVIVAPLVASRRHSFGYPAGKGRQSRDEHACHSEKSEPFAHSHRSSITTEGDVS
jgi:hypothetical protein